MEHRFWNSEPLNFTHLDYNNNPNYDILSPQPQPMMSMPQQGTPYETLYPYGYIESRRGYTPPPINDITIRQTTFKFDMNLDAWVYEQSNNKGKTTIIPVARGLAPNDELYIEERGKLKWIVLPYSVNGDNDPDIIPSEDFYKGKISKYFTHINKIPGCPDKLYNELLCFLIKTFQNAKTITLYPHQGWNYLEGTGVYVQSPDKTDPLFKLVPESVIRRKLAKINIGTEHIVNMWLNLYMKHPALMFIGGLKIGSLLQYFFNSAGFFIQQLFIIEPSEKVGTDKLTAMLAPNNAPEYPLTTLDSDSKKLLKDFGYIYDDVAVCVDRTFADEEDKIRTNSLYTGCGNQLIDMMLATLFNFQRENCTTPLDVFIDEIQNQNFSKISPICKIMKEGRKIHMSFFGATQDYYPRNTELGSVMGKAGTEIFLRPTTNSESVVAAELRFNKADMARFDSMGRGDIIVKGSLYNKEQDRNISVILCGHVDDYPK